MAKVLYSGIGIVASSGSLDNTVYSRNRYGHFSRARVIPTNTPSAKKDEWKILLAAASQLWSLIPQVARDDWNLAAMESRVCGVLGVDFYLSGYNMFVQQSINIFISNGVPSFLPVKPVSVPYPKSLSVSIPNLTTMNYTIRFSDGSYQVPANCLLLLKASVGVSVGITYKRSNIIFFGSFQPLDVVNPIDKYSQYSSEIGSLVSNTKVFFEAFLVHSVTGQRSPTLKASAIVP